MSDHINDMPLDYPHDGQCESEYEIGAHAWTPCGCWASRSEAEGLLRRAETAEAALARVEALAKIQATSLRAAHRADMARNWLDVLAIIERADLTQPSTDE